MRSRHLQNGGFFQEFAKTNAGGLIGQVGTDKIGHRKFL
jgi:hypothetical protein